MTYLAKEGPVNDILDEYNLTSRLTEIRRLESTLATAEGVLRELIPMAEYDPDGMMEPEGLQILERARAVLKEEGNKKGKPPRWMPSF